MVESADVVPLPVKASYPFIDGKKAFRAFPVVDLAEATLPLKNS